MDTSETLTLQQKALLRKSIRHQRRQLSPLQQKNAATQLIRNLKRFGLLLRGQHIALYLANDGEICPRRLIPLLDEWGKKAYLPVIHPLNKQEIQFCQLSKTTRFTKNRFGIEEPVFKSATGMSARQLSTVLMPLVAFDEKGNRMGMGGGFYDRAFGYKHKSRCKKTRLIGLAHELQKQDTLPVNDWDIPLDAIVTDKAIYTK